MKQKSDKRPIYLSHQYEGVIKDLQYLVKGILLQLRTEVKESKEILFLYSLARASIQIESIFHLYEMKHFSDCMILYRTQVERLLTLYYIIDTNTVKEYDDWSFIQNFEERNKAKSDPNQQSFLEKKFWTESQKRIRRYQQLKSIKTRWIRPNQEQLENAAKNHNVSVLFEYGYKYASGFVHPLSSDGEDEFGLITGIKPRNKPDFNTIPIIHNSVIVFLCIINFVLSQYEYLWNEHVNKMLDGIEDFFQSGNLKYKESMKLVEYAINNSISLFKKKV